MKVLLVQPKNRSYVVMPSLGLGYLAAVLRTRGHEVTILNGHRDDAGCCEILRRIAAEKIDVVGFQLFTYDMGAAAKYLPRIRHAFPKILLIAGGPHPSAVPRGTLELLPDLDFVFAGEAENSLPLLLETLETPAPRTYDAIPGLAYRDGRQIVEIPREFVADLDALPLPAWDLLEPERYPEAPHGAFSRQFPSAPIIVSRGCPCNCTFCAGKTISGSRLRNRSVASVLQELQLLKDRGIREFHIEDENLTANRSFLFAFCAALQQKQFSMSWSLPSGIRIDTIDREMVTAMEAAGCYSLAVGIEFGTQRLLELSGKRITLEQIREKISIIKESSIKVTGFFLFGIPGETNKEREETLKFALSLPLDRAQFNNYMPLPGTQLWDELQARDSLSAVRWENFFVHGVAWAETPSAGRRLKGFQRRAYLSFYLRPRILWGVVREIRSLRHLFFLLRRFADAMR